MEIWIFGKYMISIKSQDLGSRLGPGIYTIDLGLVTLQLSAPLPSYNN